MNPKLSTSSWQSGIQLNIASRPLQFIAGLSALVFVLNFTLEVLVSYGASYVHLVQVLCLIGILSAWVLVEDLLILRLHDWSPFRILTFLLIIQVAMPVLPDSILNKMGRLSDEEWQIIKSHAAIGEAVLSSADIEVGGDQGVVKKAIQIAGGHHEKWDGTGYPRGLKGNEIPLSARIMALADVYDALVSERVYKSGWSHEDAVKEIVSKKDIHFDPLVVDALIAEQSNFQEIANKYRDN